MTRHLASTVFVAGAVLLTAGKVVAEGVTDTVEVTLDGVAQIWPVVGPDADFPAESVHFRDFGFVWQASLQAVGPVPSASDEADDVAAPVLTITFSGLDGDIAATEASIVLVTGPDARRYVSAEGDGGLVLVEQLDLADDSALTAGSFEAQLCLREGVFATAETEDCHTVTGRFSARLPRDDL